MSCISGKKTYPTYYAADKENRKKIKEHGVHMDIYKCRWCNQYHLTGHTKVVAKNPYKRERKHRNAKGLSARSHERTGEILDKEN